MCDTPKNSKPLSAATSFTDEFKLISIPSSYTPKVAGNLTGNHRIVRDCVADIYNAVQQWNKHFLRGVQILSEIKTIKFTEFENNQTYSNELQAHCNELDLVISSLSNIIELFTSYYKTMQGISKLLTNVNEIIFSTWKFSTFLNVTQAVLDSYRRELELKIFVKESICHVKDKCNVAFYFLCWVNEAYIDEELTIQLEAMLVETGHK